MGFVSTNSTQFIIIYDGGDYGNHHFMLLGGIHIGLELSVMVMVLMLCRSLLVSSNLVNNLVAFGGKTRYVKWAKEAGVKVSSLDDSFFTNPVIKNYFKACIKAVVKRKNSLSGVR
ncbi:hypothetical protein OIU76_021605 [Salix suchowensis]|nr:hypothetical protein OIU76_021605 [Salix suchowensis]